MHYRNPSCAWSGCRFPLATTRCPRLRQGRVRADLTLLTPVSPPLLLSHAERFARVFCRVACGSHSRSRRVQASSTRSVTTAPRVPTLGCCPPSPCPSSTLSRESVGRAVPRSPRNVRLADMNANVPIADARRDLATPIPPCGCRARLRCHGCRVPQATSNLPRARARPAMLSRMMLPQPPPDRPRSPPGLRVVPDFSLSQPSTPLPPPQRRARGRTARGPP